MVCRHDPSTLALFFFAACEGLLAEKGSGNLESPTVLVLFRSKSLPPDRSRAETALLISEVYAGAGI
jgi:hypothetical protein